MKILEELKNLTETSTTWKIQSKGKTILFGQLDGPYPDKFLIVINGRKNIVEFHKLIQKLWKGDIELFDNITLETFQSAIIKLIREKYESDESFDQLDFRSIRKGLLVKETSFFEIFKELKGCQVATKEPITLSNFNFYSWPKHLMYIRDNFKEAFTKNEIYFYNPSDNKTLLSTKVNAKELDRAYEIADKNFKKLESILRYILTDTSHSNEGCNLYDIGIFDFREQNWLTSVRVTKDSIGSSSKIIGTYKELLLTDELLCGKESRKKRIWEILKKPKPNKLEVKILNSIEWIGKAKHEIDIEKAFIQYFFSIESLMNFNEIGIISPSVSYQMCEYISLLLGNTEKERIELDEIFRHLYSIRSAIVHGNSKEFSKYDLEDAKALAERLVNEFLTREYLINLSSKDNYKELKELIKKRKYASS